MTIKKKSVKKKVATKKRVVKKRATSKKRVEKLDGFGLTVKDREFADLYRGGDDKVRGNAKRSYMRIHPRAKESTAEVEGSKLLRLPKIDSYLRMKGKEIEEKCDINAQWLLERLASEANADLADLYDEAGGMLPVHQWPEIWRKGLVAGLDVHQEYRYENGRKIPDGVIVKVKMSDRVKRLELIGRHVSVNAFPNRQEITGPDGGPQEHVIMDKEDYAKVRQEMIEKDDC